MTHRRQALVSILLLGGAAATVAFYVLFGGGGAGPTAGAGALDHDHAAMLAAPAGAPQPVRLDAEGARRIGITYATAEYRPLRRVVSTIGIVEYDETRLVAVSPKVEGWVERLFVDFTGAAVRRGQPLLALYSPMLVTAQEELLLAHRLAAAAADAPAGRPAGSAAELIEAARRRLRLWDVPDDEIARIERAGAPQKALVLVAPAGGTVIAKDIVEGARVMPGADLFRIADLSRVWIMGEVFEKDLSLVRRGQPARVSVEAYPGESFAGVVSYVYPTVSVEGRTARVRIELDNPGQRLKPGMYARVELEAVEDREGLVIPRSAIHYTGQRALVFVRAPDGLLVHREVTVGLAAGDLIEVLAGLAPGEVVVSSANFLVDAESSMRGHADTLPAAGRDPHLQH